MGKISYLLIFTIIFFASVSASNYSLTFNQSGGESSFLKKIVFDNNYSNAEIILNLEKGVVIENKEVFPEGYKIETDGEVISIKWDLRNVTNGQTFAIFVNLEKPNQINYFYSGVILFILILAIMAFIFYLRKKNKKEKKSYGYLLDSEKKIISELDKAERKELWQKQLQISTQFSKAKLSRLLRNLESRGLIKRIPLGNTNRIVLK